MSDYATNNIQSILDHPEYKPGQGYRLDTLRKFVIHLLAERAELSTLQEKSASQDLIYAILLGIGAQDFPSPPPLETLATHVAGKAAKYDDTDAAEVERLQAAIDATADKLGIDRRADHSHYETLTKIEQKYDALLPLAKEGAEG